MWRYGDNSSQPEDCHQPTQQNQRWRVWLQQTVQCKMCQVVVMVSSTQCHAAKFPSQLIEEMCPTMSESLYTQANMECNVSKNRYPNSLPCKTMPLSLSIYLCVLCFHNWWFCSLNIILLDDHCRVMLQTTAHPGSEYINASFIDVSTNYTLYIKVCSIVPHC